MADSPWQGDTCSLVDAFRSGQRTPLDELEATLAAIETSPLNAVSHVDADAARAAAATADVTLPFGGVPTGVKQGLSVAGWPACEGSLALADREHGFDATHTVRLRDAGAVLVCQTTQSEFAGLNQTRTKLYGATRNPWDLASTPGGSSGGSAALVAGGVLTLATAGDGGGSTRIPAGFCGLPGLKGTYGRIPKGPDASLGNMTAVSGCMSRSVRDIARYLDVTAGWDPRDPFSLPKVEGWERDLGTRDLRGLRVVVAPDLQGKAVVRQAVAELIEAQAELLIGDAGLRRVDVDVDVAEGSLEWAVGGMSGILRELGDRWPECADQLTGAIRYGIEMSEKLFTLEMAKAMDVLRTENNEKMARLFDQADLVIASTNPDVAFVADGRIPTTVEGVEAGLGNNGALTIPSNFYGNAAISIPVGSVDGKPVGLQILAPHFREDWLLDLALLVERNRPWPLVAPI